MDTQYVKTNLKKKWDIIPYHFWIPLDGNVTEDTIYFNVEDFEDEFGYEKLNEILCKINIGSIYSFDEHRENKIYTEILIKEYDGPDIFFTNENADWVIYQTHESTISFAGKELIHKIKSYWINWQEYANPWDKYETSNKLCSKKQNTIWIKIKKLCRKI